MRPYKPGDIETVRYITLGYSVTHGDPIAWGWDAIRSVGLRDFDAPEWGNAPVTADGGDPWVNCRARGRKSPSCGLVG